jgi:hypothetical protein
MSNETRTIDGDTFIMSANDGRILLTKNDKSSMTFSIEQARKIGSALLFEGAAQSWKSK